MNHVSVGVFHDDALGRELGKKATESDIVVSHRKVGDCILSFMSAVDDKLFAKSQIASAIDAAIVVFNGMTKELGETIVLLDSLNVSNGMAVTSPSATADQIISITKNTSLRSFAIEDKDPIRILEGLKAYRPERSIGSPPTVVVDHSFSVKGVGEIVLGFVKKGTVKKYDTLQLLPINKEVTVRSIQVQDEDQEEADAGTRVGLAVKGASVDEMRRGSILCSPGSAQMATTLDLSFEKSPFYSDALRDGVFHTTVGMQTLPVKVTKKTDTSILIESERPIVFSQNDTFLLLDLNAKKMRVVGKGHTNTP